MAKKSGAATKPSGGKGRGRGGARGGRGRPTKGDIAVDSIFSTMSVAGAGAFAKTAVRDADGPTSNATARAPRRDIDEKALRAVTEKYTLPLELIYGAVDTRGAGLLETVAQKISSLQGSNKKLNTAFWEHMEDLFPVLRQSAAGSLQFPDEAETVDADFLATLTWARLDNPAQRDTQHFVKAMLHVEKLNLTEVIGVTKKIQVDSKITLRNSVKLQFALLGALARTGFQMDAKLWEIMGSSWEAVVIHVFESSKTPVKNFVVAHRKVLELWFDSADLEHLHQCNVHGKDPDTTIIRRAFAATKIASSLFHDMAKKKSVQNFVAHVEEQLDSLEHHDYDLNEKASFEQIMRTEVAELKESGVMDADGKKAKIKYLTSYQEQQLLHIDDEWKLRYYARLKTSAVSLGLLSGFPWELAQWPSGGIEGCRETLKIPLELLEPLQNAREVALGHIKHDNTIVQMQKTLSHNSKDLLVLDPAMSLDFEYLDLVTPILTKKVHDDTLEALPCEKKPMKCVESLKALETVRS